MSSTPTTRNRLAKQGTGDGAGTWGAVLNSQVFDLIDEALDGLSTVAVNGNVTLTSVNYASDDARHRVLKFTGTGGFTVTVPGVEKFYVIHNACPTTVDVATGAGAVALIPAAQITAVYCDGANVYAFTPSGGSSFLTPVIVTSATSQALVVGPNGITNPAFQVDASTASAATGLVVTAKAAGGGALLTVTSSGANEDFYINAKGSGAIRLATASTGNLIFGNVIINRANSAITGLGTVASAAQTITSATSQALVVGPNSSTNPSFLVNAAAASASTGISVTAAAVGSGANLAAISPGTNENLTINAKGSGTITLASSSTGAIRIGNVSVAPTTGKIALGGGAGFAGDYLTGVSTNIVAGFDCSAAGGVGQALTLNRTGSDGGAAGFYRSGSSVGSIAVTATATAYNTTSDARLKTDVAPLGDVGAIIDALAPVSFAWRYAEGQPADVGFLAQDLAALVPAAVSRGDDDPALTPSDPGFRAWGVDRAVLVTYLVAELKALRARVAALEAR